MRNRTELYTRVILSFVLVSIALLGCKAKPSQEVLATQTPLPTSTATLTAELLLNNIPNTSSPSGNNMPSNCVEILPGQYTWNAAQSIDDPSTIYDFGLYGVGYPNGEYVGTIIPEQWDVKTSTENQKKLREQLPGAVVCGVYSK
jgi:hypothetical protein